MTQNLEHSDCSPNLRYSKTCPNIYWSVISTKHHESESSPFLPHLHYLQGWVLSNSIQCALYISVSVPFRSSATASHSPPIAGSLLPHLHGAHRTLLCAGKPILQHWGVTRLLGAFMTHMHHRNRQTKGLLHNQFTCCCSVFFLSLGWGGLQTADGHWIRQRQSNRGKEMHCILSLLTICISAMQNNSWGLIAEIAALNVFSAD